MSNRPIGIFDSGVGGTSIFKEIHKLMPLENTIYLADSANAPYGDKAQSQIIDFSFKNTELLLNKDCKIIVVACNTATTNCIDLLRKKYDVPFIGIEPAIKPAALQTKTNSVGILATKGTLTSELFHKTTNLYGSDINVVEQIGEGLVQLVEEGRIHSEEMDTLLTEYLKPMLEANIDHLVLGCTHYPYLIPVVRKLIPDHVKIIDSGQAVAQQTKNILGINTLLNTQISPSTNIFYINKKTETLSSLLNNQYQVSYLDF